MWAWNCFLVLVQIWVLSHGFKWTIDESTLDQKMSFTERYMYGSNSGPLWSKGHSLIHLDLDVSVLFHNVPELNISVMFYASDEQIPVEDLQYNICNGIPQKNKNKGIGGPPMLSHLHLFQRLKDLKFTVDYPELHTYPLTAHPITPGEGGRHLTQVSSHGQSVAEGGEIEQAIEDDFGPQVMRYTTHIKTNYKVRDTSMQFALFSVCPQNRQERLTELKGTVAFKNTYGYLPAMYFGFLPWSGIRFCLFVIFDAIFIFLCCRYSDKLLNVHKAIAFVLFIATFEAASWFATYEIMNITGQPFCCPFPASVITSLVSEVFRKTSSRALLLMICLGWGVALPALPRRQVVKVLLITVAYMISGFVYNTTEIMAASRIREGGLATHEAIYTVPFLICDIVFISLIYFALVATLEILKAKNETVKLEKYKTLGKVLIFFVALFSLFTLILAVCQWFDLYFPWQFLWVETASWDMLNFSVLVTVTIVWRPSDRAHLLAYHQQLATSESEADADDGMQMTQMTRNEETAMPIDDQAGGNDQVNAITDDYHVLA